MVNKASRGIAPLNRQLTEQECEVLTWLLEHGVPGAPDFVSQIPRLSVVGKCTCGCPILYFASDGVPVKRKGEQGISDYIAEVDGEIEIEVLGIGYPLYEELFPGRYATKWKGRCAYRYSVESTAYLDPHATGQGIGSHLYQFLLAELRGRGMHVVIGGIALPNEASVFLHESSASRKWLILMRVGQKFENGLTSGIGNCFSN